VPPDKCPYPRPFAAGFIQCNAYQPAPYIGLDTHQQPLPPVWTCRHLTVGEEKQSGGHYPRCELGDCQARQSWVESLGSKRIEKMRRLRTDFGEFARPYLQAIWAAKGRQLKHHDAALSGALKRVSEEFLRAADSYVREHAAQLKEVDVPIEAAREIMLLPEQASLIVKAD